MQWSYRYRLLCMNYHPFSLYRMGTQRFTLPSVADCWILWRLYYNVVQISESGTKLVKKTRHPYNPLKICTLWISNQIFRSLYTVGLLDLIITERGFRMVHLSSNLLSPKISVHCININFKKIGILQIYLLLD